MLLHLVHVVLSTTGACAVEAETTYFMSLKQSVRYLMGFAAVSIFHVEFDPVLQIGEGLGSHGFEHREMWYQD